jgi:hypothetical protein
VDDCNWLTVAVSIKRPDMRERAQPERRWMLIPREDFEIIDDGYTVGLKSTGSKTIVINDVFVPGRPHAAEHGARGWSGAAAQDQHPSDVRRHHLGHFHRCHGRRRSAPRAASCRPSKTGCARSRATSTTACWSTWRATRRPLVDAVHAMSMQNAQRNRTVRALGLTTESARQVPA